MPIFDKLFPQALTAFLATTSCREVSAAGSGSTLCQHPGKQQRHFRIIRRLPSDAIPSAAIGQLAHTVRVNTANSLRRLELDQATKGVSSKLAEESSLCSCLSCGFLVWAHRHHDSSNMTVRMTLSISWEDIPPRADSLVTINMPFLPSPFSCGRMPLSLYQLSFSSQRLR